MSGFFANTMSMKDLQLAVLLGELFTAVVIAFFYIKSRLPKQTIEQQSQLIKALEGRIDSLEEETRLCNENHLESIDKIKVLQQRIDNTVDIPLSKIAEHMEKTNTILEQLVRKGE